MLGRLPVRLFALKCPHLFGGGIILVPVVEDGRVSVGYPLSGLPIGDKPVLQKRGLVSL